MSKTRAGPTGADQTKTVSFLTRRPTSAALSKRPSSIDTVQAKTDSALLLKTRRGPLGAVFAKTPFSPRQRRFVQDGQLHLWFYCVLSYRFRYMFRCAAHSTTQSKPYFFLTAPLKISEIMPFRGSGSVQHMGQKMKWLEPHQKHDKKHKKNFVPFALLVPHAVSTPKRHKLFSDIFGILITGLKSLL